MADSSDLDKRRRDLYAISLSLILFNVAGGSLADSAAATFFGGIHVTRPWVLVWGAWMSWMYFLWRFWLTANPIWSNFLDDLDNAVFESKEYRIYCHKVISSLTKWARSHASQLHDGGRPQAEVDKVLGLVNAVGRRAQEDSDARFLLDPRSYANSLNRERAGSVETLKQSRDAPNPHIWSHFVFPRFEDAVWDSVFAEHPWGGRVRWKVLRRAAAAAVIRKHAFSDKVLPIIVAACAPIAILSRLVWRYFHS